MTDALEELEMERVTQRHRNGADLDLIAQFQQYESALKHEDQVEDDEEIQTENLRCESLYINKNYCSLF